MGDIRFEAPYRRVAEAESPHAAMQRMADVELVMALAGASQDNPYLANVLASEAMNRVRRKSTILQHAGEGMYALNLDGKLAYLNPAAERMLGWTEEELRPLNMHDTIHYATPEGGHHAAESCPIVGVTSKGESVHVDDDVFTRKDGTSFPVAYTAAPIFRDGEVEGTVVVFQDITERRRAEAALRASEARKTAILKASLDAIITINADSRIVEWNPAAERLFGYSRHEALGRQMEELIIPARFREAHRQGMDRYLKTGEGPVLGRRIELPAIRRDGTEFPSEISIHPLGGNQEPLFTGFLRDITEQKEAERQRAESEERYHALYDESPTMYLTLRQDGTILNANHWGAGYLGYEVDELVGQHHWNFYHAEDRARIRDLFLDFIADPETHLNEWEGCKVRKAGDVLSVKEVVRMVPGRDGEPVVLATCTDVSDLYRVQQRLRTSEERYRRLFEAVPDAVITVDADRRITDCNPAFTELTGYACDELRGRSTRILYGDDESYDEVAGAMRDPGSPGPVTEVARWRKKSGEGFPAKVTVHRITGPDGELTGYVKVAVNLEALERAESAIRESDERARRILERITDAFFALDPAWRFTYINPQAERVLARPREELLGRNVWEEFPEAVGTTFQRQYERAMATGESVSFEEYYPPLETWFEVSAYPSEEGLSVFFRDVTERKQAEEHLASAKQDLERRVAERTRDISRANEELEAFSYSVSHDLRAPLRGIESFARILQEDYGDALDTEGREILDRLQRESTRATRLVQDLLTLSRASQGEIRREEVDLTDLAHALAQELRASDPDRPAEFAIDEGLTAYGDPRLVRQVMTNLLGNAWKYTSREPVTRIEVGAEDGEDGPRFFVRDNGVGFDPGKSSRLFEAFRRLHSPNDFEGTGIGLAIVRQIVQRHGGRVWAEGQPGEGATFRFTLGAGDGDR